MSKESSNNNKKDSQQKQPANTQDVKAKMNIDEEINLLKTEVTNLKKSNLKGKKLETVIKVGSIILALLSLVLTTVVSIINISNAHKNTIRDSTNFDTQLQLNRPYFDRVRISHSHNQQVDTALFYYKNKGQRTGIVTKSELVLSADSNHANFQIDNELIRVPYQDSAILFKWGIKSEVYNSIKYVSTVITYYDVFTRRSYHDTDYILRDGGDFTQIDFEQKKALDQLLESIQRSNTLNEAGSYEFRFGNTTKVK